jgi:Ca2+-binding EF-hand superfamily protein
LISADGSSALSALDADQDQMLSRPELLGFLNLPFDAELPLSFGDIGSVQRRGEAKSRFRLSRRGSDGGYRLHVGSGQVKFERRNRDPSSSNSNRLPRLRDFDADSNGSLDANELMNVPDRPEFAMLDADRDGKISGAEFDSYFLQQSRIAASRFVLEVSDEGSDLFTALDTNFDRVLTPRELKSAPALLNSEDRDGDGFLGGVEMSYSLALELSRGSPRAAQNNLVGERRAAAEPSVKERREGPGWFQKMDRNRDGDVSLSEFLGSRATFRQLDKDGNQLLSPEEVP